MEDDDILDQSDWEAYDPSKVLVDVDPEAATGSPKDAIHLLSFPRGGRPPPGATSFSLDRRVRVQVLSDWLVRVEYAHDERLFEDRPTFCFVQRGLARGAETATVELLGERGLIVRTARMVVVVDPATGDVGVRGNGAIVARLVRTCDSLDDGIQGGTQGPGKVESEIGVPFVGLDGEDDGDLLGTCRTLDGADGYARRDWNTHVQRRVVRLGHGLLSRQGGITFIDDTSRPVFTEDGWFAERPSSDEYVDTYALASGADYLGALREFLHVAGPIPMVPRRYLGNWWSRYHAYTQAELGDLVLEFEKYRVPLSMCIIDMDWHLVKHEDGVPKASDGWTGYTWNQKLFPDPSGFIGWLHDRDLGTALNLHPAGSIYCHEKNYDAFARFIGAKALKSRDPIPFDVTDVMSCCAYFKTLIHPLEESSGDLGKWSWWCDWQQGAKSRLRGVDPLFVLNHLHFRDMERLVDGRTVRRPIVFSRFAGLGSHRTPIGFSGDTHSTWSSLAFQTFMTSTASNCAFTYWSHDIGGHTGGMHDDALYVRWIQFGCFSPILRLHSSNNPYALRMPWSFGRDACDAASEALRLRHALVPYIYSMCWRTHAKAEPLVMPMYYLHPTKSDAYAAPGQYWFGDQLVASPLSYPPCGQNGLSRQAIWLPPVHSTRNGAQWRDVFTGEVRAPGWLSSYFKLEDIPVYAPPGGILPMASMPDKSATGATLNSVGNPSRLDLRIVAGGNGTFNMYEDEESGDLRAISTNIRVASDVGSLHIVVSPPVRVKHNSGVDAPEECPEPASLKDVDGVIPLRRSWHVHLVGLAANVEATYSLSETEKEIMYPFTHYDAQTETATFEINDVSWKDRISLRLRAREISAARDRTEEKATSLISAMKLGVGRKWELAKMLPNLLKNTDLLRDGIPNLEEVCDTSGPLFTVTPAMKLALLEIIDRCGYTRPFLTRPGAPAVIWSGRRNDVVVELDNTSDRTILKPGSALIVYPKGTGEAKLHPSDLAVDSSIVREAVDMKVSFGGIVTASIPMHDPDNYQSPPEVKLE